jgi:hypothetical protein
MEPERNEEPERTGLPVFVESGVRGVSDAIGPVAGGEWHPANTAATKLWACVEAARDIDDVLGSDPVLGPRRLKVLITPLQSLRVAVASLGDFLRTSPEVADQVGPAIRKELERLLPEFKDSSVFTTPVDLLLIRDKLSAHVDRKTKSWSAQDMLAPLRPIQIGAALRLCMSTLQELLSIDVYAWTASDCPEGFVRLMAVEPSLVTMAVEDGRPVAIARLDIARSPRYAVLELCQGIVAKSQWMLADDAGGSA